MRAPATRFHRMLPATERDPRVRELYDAGKNDGKISLATNYNHNKGIKTGKHKRKKGEK